MSITRFDVRHIAAAIKRSGHESPPPVKSSLDQRGGDVPPSPELSSDRDLYCDFRNGFYYSASSDRSGFMDHPLDAVGSLYRWINGVEMCHHHPSCPQIVICTVIFVMASITVRRVIDLVSWIIHWMQWGVFSHI